MSTALDRQPDKLDYLSPTQFRFGIHQLPKVEFFTTAATIPGINMGEAIFPTPFKDIPIMGDKLTYDNLEISFIVDDHPQKVNKFTPGDKIKVIPTNELIKKMPKYTIILAWIHAENIISNNHEYLRKGGNFVLLLPEIRVITAEDIPYFS